MAFSKTSPALPAPAATPTGPVDARPAETKPVHDSKVRGQVAMHAIETGYLTASRLVLTLAPKPAESRALLHDLAAEIAKKIEEYSFHD